MKKLAQFFQDGDGALSAMRLLFLVWGLGVFAVWVYLSIKTGKMAELDLKVLGWLTTLAGAKALQNMTEKDVNINKPQ